ncbi:PBP1A family penicillin-binding protein [Thermoanaerobacterium sp. RBIITD]|uniref:transglycosylase domain-containing protein n=1 Tax=Thermoanaerobacterium sp. RBIITD TaxID=1550240 RepID=UPI000BB6CFB4|nr:PBP1A family penicillin-binding protein [Thermoanaerobacterium sp. RBIITD]SNX53350.1 penicillin-binding protein 1A [Thermoanaerobacterium sp. RBIITD]
MENNTNVKRSDRNKRTKKKGTVKKVFTAIFWTILIVFLAGVGAVGGKVLAIIKNTPPLSQDALTKMKQSSIIYVKNDNGEWDKAAILHGADNRLWVSIDKIPKNLQNAVVAIEDQRFYKNNLGIDPKRIAGALVTDLKAGGKPVEGASTITQQLVKNTMLSNEKTLTRKIQEAVLAWKLEQKYSKQQILEAYLNTIYLGGPHINAYGVQAAALQYFGKDVSQLDLAESAMIAGITNNPSIYSPDSNKEQATERQHLVLSEMLKQGYITQDEYNKAINEKLNYSFNNLNLTNYNHKSFIDKVINDVASSLSQKLNISNGDALNMIYNGGLRIYATMDPKIQSIMEDAFKNPKLFPVDPTRKEAVQGAMVIMDWKTGEVKGIVGGRDTNDFKVTTRGLNLATDSYRQPGSSIKPLTVYGPALESGLTAATVVDDVPTTFQVPGSKPYTPHNYESNYYHGLVTLREAITDSLNVPAVQVVNKIGINVSANYGKKFGLNITKDDMYLPALALGGMTKGISPLQEAAGYGAIANKGMYISPITFTEVKDAQGKTLIDNIPNKHVVLSEQNAYILRSMMQDVINQGTGTAARLPNMAVAGKTGTSEGSGNVWFSGFTPYYVGTVWMGYKSGNIPVKNYGSPVVGGTFPANMWRTVMLQIHQNLPPKDFTDKPSGIVYETVCKDSGDLPTDLCRQDPRGDRTYTEMFVDGTQPTSFCTVHVTAKINTLTGKLASRWTLPFLVKEEVFINPPGRTPEQNAHAADGKYVVPTAVDDSSQRQPSDNQNGNPSGNDNGGTAPVNGTVPGNTSDNTGQNNSNGNNNGTNTNGAQNSSDGQNNGVQNNTSGTTQSKSKNNQGIGQNILNSILGN